MKKKECTNGPVKVEMTAVIHPTFINYLLNMLLCTENYARVLGFGCDDKLA